MAKTKRQHDSRTSPKRRGSEGGFQRADFVATAWMMSVMMAAVCEIGAIATRAYLRFRPGVVTIELFAGTLLFASVVVGTLSLVLLAAVLHLRPQAPPPSILAFGLVVGVAPLIAVLFVVF